MCIWSFRFFALATLFSLYLTPVSLFAQTNVSSNITLERYQTLSRAMERSMVRDAGGCSLKDDPFLSTPPADLYSFSAYSPLYMHQISSRWSWTRRFEEHVFSSWEEIDTPEHRRNVLYSPACYYALQDGECLTSDDWWEGASNQRWESTDNDGTMYGGSFRTKWTHTISNDFYGCDQHSCDLTSEWTSENWHNGEVTGSDPEEPYTQSYGSDRNDRPTTSYRCPIQYGVNSTGSESQRQVLRCSGANVMLGRSYSSKQPWEHFKRDGSTVEFERSQQMRHHGVYRRGTSVRQFEGVFDDQISIPRSRIIPVKMPKLTSYAARAELELDMSVYVAHSVPECDEAFAPQLELELSIFTADQRWISIGSVGMGPADEEEPLPSQICDENGRCFYRYEVKTVITLNPRVEKDYEIIGELLDNRKLTFTLYDNALELPAQPFLEEQTWDVRCREIPTAVNIAFTYNSNGSLETRIMPEYLRKMQEIEAQARMEGPILINDQTLVEEADVSKARLLDYIKDSIKDVRTVFLYMVGHSSEIAGANGQKFYGFRIFPYKVGGYSDEYYLFPEDLAYILEGKRAVVALESCRSAQFAARDDLWQGKDIYFIASSTGATLTHYCQIGDYTLATKMFHQHLGSATPPALLDEIDRHYPRGEITLGELTEHMQGAHIDPGNHAGANFWQRHFQANVCSFGVYPEEVNEPRYCIECGALGNIVLREKEGDSWFDSNASPEPTAQPSPSPSPMPY